MVERVSRAVDEVGSLYASAATLPTASLGVVGSPLQATGCVGWVGRK